MKTSETTITKLEIQAISHLEDVLGKISCVQPHTSHWSDNHIYPDNLRYETELKHDQKIGYLTSKWELNVIVKNNAHPRQLRSTIYAHKQQVATPFDKKKNKYTVYVSPFISEQAAKICQEEHIGYLDFGGNCHLEFENIYLHIEGRPNQHKEERTLKNLFADKSARVLRTLLEGPLRGHKVTDIANRSNVSLGLVSKIRNHLIDQEYATDTPTGVCITHPQKLLNSWVNRDRFLDRTTIHDYALLEIDHGLIIEKLEQLLRSKSIDFAYTQWFAAYNRAAHTKPPVISCYVNELPSKDLIKRALGARETHAGTGRLRLIESKDLEGVMIGRQEVKGRQQVSDLQTYLDLYGAGLRADEQCEELLKLKDFNGGWNTDV